MILKIEKKSMQRCDECRNAKIRACIHAVLDRGHREREKQLAYIRQLYGGEKERMELMRELFS